MAFSITGQIKVSTLKKRFHKEFGLTLRVYDGRSFADEDKTIGQIRKKKGSGDLSIKKNMKVGTLEEKIEEEFSKLGFEYLILNQSKINHYEYLESFTFYILSTFSSN